MGFKAVKSLRRDKTKQFNVGWFWVGTWQANVQVLWPVTPLQVADYVKRVFGVDGISPERFEGRCLEITEPDGTATNLICLAGWSGTHQDHATLAHEAFHCAHHILLGRMNLTLETSEAFAYLIGELVDNSTQLIEMAQRKGAQNFRK